MEWEKRDSSWERQGGKPGFPKTRNTNQRMAWLGREHKDHFVSPPAMGRDSSMLQDSPCMPFTWMGAWLHFPFGALVQKDLVQNPLGS